MLKAIVFDFDGVIVDSEPLHWQAYSQVLQPLGAAFDYPTYLQQYVGFDDRDLVKTVFKQHHLPLDQVRLNELIAAKTRAFESIVAQGIRPLPGAVELIAEAAGYWPLAIASGALLSDIRLILPAIGDGKLLQRFKVIVTAEDVARSKPDPATYTLVAQRMDIAPADCLAIEDTQAGLDSASRAGMKTLAVATTYPPDQLTADRVVGSLAEVTSDELRRWFN